MFDFVFYVFFKKYKADEESEAPIAMSSISLSYFQFGIMGALVFGFDVFSNEYFCLMDRFSEYYIFFWILVFTILFLLFIGNYWLYSRKKLTFLEEKYNFNPVVTRIRSWMLYGLIFLLFALIILIARIGSYLPN